MNKIVYSSLCAALLVSSTAVMANDEAPAEKTTAEKTTVSAAAVQAVTAPPTVEAQQKRNNTVLISPRTGMRYTINNASNRPILFKTEALQPVTAANVGRITASNPALSSQSQQKAEQALLNMAGIQVPQQTVTADGVTPSQVLSQ